MDSATTFKPGIYTDMPAAIYHADPAPEPSLSSSIAKDILIAPVKAKMKHPRLTPAPVVVNNDAFDLGTVCHAILLQADRDRVQVVYGFDDWKKKDAQEARKEIREAGLTPVLEKEMDLAHAMAKAVLEQLAEWPDESVRRAFRVGRAEETIIHQDSAGFFHRCRLDWHDHEWSAVTDFKTTNVKNGCAAGNFERRVYELGMDIQRAHYANTYRGAYGHDWQRWHFVMVETEEPFLLTVFDVTPLGEEIGHNKIDRAQQIWRRCLSTGKWPGYPVESTFADPTPWQSQPWETRDDSISTDRQLHDAIAWQG